MRFLQSKHSLLRALEKANSFICSTFLASFRQNSIFFRLVLISLRRRPNLDAAFQRSVAASLMR
jgi:hypothetical protein